MLSRTWYRAAIAPLVVVAALKVGCGSNQAPQVSKSPSAGAEEVASGTPVQVSVEATDGDGDALRYAWTQEPAEPAGTFGDASAPATTWTAPPVEQETSFKLVVRVSDPAGEGVVAATTVRVHKPVPANQAPTVTQAASAQPSPVAGRSPVQLNVTAADADSDALSYAWTQVAPASPTGAFSDAAVRNPTWTPPAVTVPTAFTLRVVVKDGRGGSAQSEVDVEARPPVATNTAPAVEAPTASATSVRAGDELTLSVTATDADGDSLSYQWAQADGKGTFTAGQQTAQAKWYSPAVGADTDFTFNVTVRDGQGGEVTRPVTVKVTVPRYAADIQALWNTTCTGCHHDGTSGVPSGQLSLTADKSYAALVGVQSKVSCTTQARVKPNDPDASTLVDKVEGTECGTRMPRNNQSYFNTRPGELIRLRSWVLGGALNN